MNWMYSHQLVTCGQSRHANRFTTPLPESKWASKNYVQENSIGRDDLVGFSEYNIDYLLNEC